MKYKSRLWFEKATTTYCVVENMALEADGRAMPRMLLDGGEVRGQIVEVLLPKVKGKGEKDYSSVKTRSRQIKMKAETVCLQVGDRNCVRLDLDVSMSADFSDDLTKFSDGEKMVIRVLRSYGASEELIPVKDARAPRPEIDIRSEFVRVVPPHDGKSSTEGFTMDIDVKTRYALIGNEHEIAIKPDHYPNVFDNSPPVLRVLRLPTKPVTIVRNAKDFPNMDKDHLIVLEICENFFTTKAVEYSFSQSLPASKTKKREFYDVKISVFQCGKNGKTEMRDGVLFQRESSLDCFRGIVGFWCRFQTGKTRYIVSFSLWRTLTASQTSELLDEKRIVVETNERKIPPRKLHVAYRKQSHSAKPNSVDVTSFPGRICNRQISLPDESHTSASTALERHATEETSLPAKKTTSCPMGFYERCSHIRNILLALRYDCEWQEFDRQAEDFLKKYAGNTDTEIVVILEQGMACCYHSETSLAEGFIKRAMGMISQASPTLVPLLKGRASYYLANIYRKDEMALGKAQRCIESAKKHLAKNAPILDEASLAYEEGNLLLEYAHNSSVVEHAKRNFDRCTDLCSRVSTEDTKYLMLKQHDLGLMMKAMLLLDCRSKSGRESRTIDEEALLEARQCLDRIKINTVEEMSRFLQVQYHLVRSDQYFREGRPIDAEAHARTAFYLSQKYGLDSESAPKIRWDYYYKVLNSYPMN